MKLLYKIFVVPLLFLSIWAQEVRAQQCPYNVTLTATPASPQCQPTVPVRLDVGGYNPSCTQYIQSVIPLALRPSPATPVAGGFCGNAGGYGPFTLPFSFRFFCQDYTEFRIHWNGFISMGNAPQNQNCGIINNIPNATAPNNIIAGAWGVLDGNGNSCFGTTVSHGVQGVAPNRVYVVEWNRFDWYFAFNGCTAQMQIMLYEGSNKIEIHCSNLGNNFGFWNGSQGVEDATGANGLATPGRNNVRWSANDGRCFQPQGNAQLVVRNTTNGFNQPVVNNTVTDPNPPVGSSTYELLAIDPCANCTTTIARPYVVNPTPTVTINPAGPITKCRNDAPINLTASGAATYAWLPVAGLSNPAIANPVADPAATTTYTVTGTNAQGCTGTATITITVNPNPTVTINPTSVVKCLTDPAVVITASGANTYLWSPAAGLSATNIANPTANPTTTTTYTVVGTAANLCTTSATITVTVNPQPVLVATPATATRCFTDAPTQLQVTGATTYSWNPVTGLSNPAIGNPTANPPVGTYNYTVTGTSGFGCTTTTLVTLTVNPNPTVSVAPLSGAKCANDPPIQLTASGANTYVWTPATGLSAVNIANPTANPPTTTVYTVVGTNNFNCTGSSTVTITVTPNPATPVILANTNPVCPGQLSAAYSVINAPGATYNWVVPAQATLVSGQGTNAIVVNWTAGGVPTPAGNYSITVTSTVAGCPSPVATFGITVLDPPPAQPAVPVGPTPVCVRSIGSYSVTLDPTATSYVWGNIPGGAFISNGIGTNQITINWGTAPVGTYQLSVIARNTCGQSPPNFITVDVIDVRPQPSPFNLPNPICLNQSATFSVTNDPLATSYTWTNSCGWTGTSTTNSIDYIPTTLGPCVLSVVANNQCGASPVRSLIINARDVPVQPGTVNGLTSVCQNSIQNYSVPNVAGVTFTWGALPAGAIYVNGQGTNAVRINWGTAAPGTYTIDVTPSNVCGPGTAQTFEVTVLAIPGQPTINGNTPVCVNTTEVYEILTPDPSATYSWSVTPSGPSLSPSGNRVTVIWNLPGNFSLIAIPSNQCGVGQSQTINVSVVGRITPTINPIQQTSCQPDYTISGVTPAGGTFACVACPGGATVNSITGTITGMNIPNQTYVVSYTLTNPPCPNTSVQASVQYLGIIPGTVGNPQTVCSGASGTVFLTGQNGNILRWERSSDCLVYSAIQNTQPSNTFVNLTQNTCFRAIIGRGNCTPVNTNAVQITVVPNVAASASPANQTICAPTSTATVTGNLPLGTTGDWSFISGPVIANVTTNAGVGSITGLTAPGIYTFRWTLTNSPCTVKSTDVTVTVSPPLTPPNAGNDVQFCSDRFTLVGNVPVVGTASWVFLSGPVVPVLTNVGLNIGNVAGLTAPGVYTFEYRITNGNCTPLTDQISIERLAPTTQANAGLDQTTCDNFVSLQGNTPPIVGTGTWTFLTGPANPLIAQFGHIANVTGLTTPGTYIFRYTITNPPCAATTDDVIIRVLAQPSIAEVTSPVYNVCQNTSFTVRAVRPLIGRGTWTVISSPPGTTPNVVTNGVDGFLTGMTQPGAYVLRWTVDNPPCANSSFADVTVNREELLVGNINPGTNQILCNTTTTTLTAQTPIPPRSTGVWNYVSGPVPNVNVNTFGLVGTVNNMTEPGIYVFEWRVSRLTGSCPPQVASLIVEIKPSPTVANAGPDQTVCGTGPVLLTGNVPMVGTGAWSFLTGPMTPNQFASNNTLNVNNMTQSGVYCFRYTISNAPCTPSTDDVCVTISIPPVGGTVSANQTVCGGTNAGSVNLTGQSGTIVRWESSTDNFATLTVIPNVTAVQNFTNLTQTTQYRAVLGSGSCQNTFSSPVTITVVQPVMAANAGADQTFCQGQNLVTLTGNTPNNMVGTWSFLTGPVQPFSFNSANVLNVFNLNTPGTYVFRYTLSNAPCVPSFDDVNIVIEPRSVGGTLSSNASVCSGNNNGTLMLNGFTGSIQRWESSTDNGLSWNPIANNTNMLTYTNLSMPTLYRVVVQSGNCPIAYSNNVSILVSTPPSVANAGIDQNFCGAVMTTTLTGNMPMIGMGSWSVVSQPNGAVASVVTNGPLGQVSGMTFDGTYVFRWSISNAPCPPSTDDVTVTRITSSNPGNLTSDVASLCSGVNSGTLTLTGSNGTVVRWESSTNNFTNVTTISQTTNTLAVTNLTQTTSYRAVVQAGVCAPTTSNVVTIMVIPQTIPANPGNTLVTVCSSTGMLNAVAPPSGTGTWTYVTGPVPFVGIAQAGTMANLSGMTLVGNYTFRWTVNNPPCASVFADVIVARLPDGVVANAGNDVTQCNTFITLTGNDPSPATASWTFVSGPTIPTLIQGGFNANISGMINPGNYIFRYTVNQPPCPPSIDEVIVTILPGPSMAQVLANNITVCDVNTVNLTAITPMLGTGMWSFQGGPSPASILGNGVVGVVNGMTQNGTYVFRWTVTNPPCPQTSFVDVLVNRQSGVNVNAFAGSNQTVCNIQTALVSGNTPPFGTTGTWTFATGPAPASVTTFGTFGSITGMTLPGDYQFVWTISANNGCPSSSSVVTIRRADPPTLANAGGNQTICGTSTILTGNVPVNGTGNWTFISGPGPIPNLSVQNTTATVSNMNTPGTYVFRWTISNAPCTPSAADVAVTVNLGSSGGLLTGGTTACGGSNSGTLTVTGFRGNIVRWETSTDNFATFSLIANVTAGQPYNNLTRTTCYRVVVKDGGCPEATSNIECINVTPATTPADGGADQTICATTTILTGNTPTSGTPSWSFITGPSVPNLAVAGTTAVITGMNNQGIYLFRYRIDNTPCGVSDDLVSVTVNAPTVAGTASAPTTVCAGTNSGSVTLTGFVGSILTWETSTDNILFTPNGNTNAAQAFTNLTQTTWYRAVVRNSPLCPTVTSNAVQVLVRQPETANAGTPQVLCGTTTATLTGNTPVTGTPVWSFVSGPITPAVSQNGASATVTGMTAGGTYTFRYTINNVPCAPSSSNVTVQISPTPVAGTISMPMTVCEGINTGTLVLNGQIGNVVRWESSEDNFAITTIVLSNPTPQNTFFNLTRTTWYRAVVSAAGCNESTSPSVRVTVVPQPSVADAGIDQTICGTTITLNGSMANVGTPVWSLQTAPNGSSVQISQSMNIASITGMTVPGNYVFNYTISNAPCAVSTDNVQITVLAATIPGTLGSPATVCNGVNSGNLILTGQNAPILRWEFSTDNGTTWNPIGNVNNFYNYNNLNQNTLFRVAVQQAGCPVSFSNSVLITVVNAGAGGTVSGNATVCSGLNGGQLTLTGNVGNVTRWEQSEDGGVSWTTLFNNTNTQPYANLTRTTLFRAVINNPCGNVFSSFGTITVAPASVAGSISAPATVCAGSNNGVLSLTGNVGNVVSWQTSTDGFNFVNNGNTGQTQSYANLTQTTFFRVTVQSANCSAVTSGSVAITVTPGSVGGTLNAPATVCAGNNSGTLNLTGQSGSIVRWEFSTDGGNNWNVINNNTASQTYSNLNLDTRYRVIVQSGGCPQAVSSEVQISIFGANNGGTASANATVCAGNNIGQITLSNFVGTILRWEQSLDGVNFTATNNNTVVQNYANLNQTTFFRAVVTNQQCGGQAFSNTVTITVTNNSVAGTISGQQSVCANVANGTLTLSGQNGNVVRWESSTDGFNFTSINVNTNTLSYSVNQTTFYRAVVQSGNCAPATTSTVVIGVNPPSVAGTVSGGGTVCSGNNSGNLTLSGNQGSVVRWEFSVNGGQTWSPINVNSQSISFSNLTQQTSYRAVVQNGNCPAVLSNEVTITIGSNIQLTAAPVIGCSGSGSINANATGGVGSYTYSISPFIQADNDNGQFTNVPPGNYTITARDAAGCSRSVTVNVGNTPSAPSISGVQNVTISSGQVFWSAVPPGVGITYTLRYRILGSQTWTTISNITNTFVTISGLQNNTTYEIALAYQCCPTCPLSDFSTGAVNQFTTLSTGTCGADPVPVPGGFFTNQLTATSVRANWNRVIGAQGYIVSWGLSSVNPATWQQIIVCDPTTTYLITNLLPNTNYGVRIRTNCTNCTTALNNNDRRSVWSFIISYTTPANKEGVVTVNESASVPEIYPNPNKGAFTVRYESFMNETVGMTLYDATGREVFRKTETAVEGTNEWAVEPGNLSSGIYFLRMNVGGKERNLKVIVE